MASEVIGLVQWGIYARLTISIAWWEPLEFCGTRFSDKADWCIPPSVAPFQHPSGNWSNNLGHGHGLLWVDRNSRWEERRARLPAVLWQKGHRSDVTSADCAGMQQTHQNWHRRTRQKRQLLAAPGMALIETTNPQRPTQRPSQRPNDVHELGRLWFFFPSWGGQMSATVPASGLLVMSLPFWDLCDSQNIP